MLLRYPNLHVCIKVLNFYGSMDDGVIISLWTWDRQRFTDSCVHCWVSPVITGILDNAKYYLIPRLISSCFYFLLILFVCCLYVILLLSRTMCLVQSEKYIDLLLSGASSLYREMAPLSASDRSYYSSSLAKYQIDFVVRRPTRLKDLIRLVKHWKKRHLPVVISNYVELHTALL